MPKEQKQKKEIAYYKAYYEFEYGEAVKALSPDFDFEDEKNPLQKPKMKAIRRSVVISQRLWTDNPSLKKKKTLGPSRRGKFGTLPLSIGGSENIDGNSPGCGNDNLGLRVKKTFHDEVTGKPRLFYGIVTAYNVKHGLYKVSYEDGDEEEVTPAELEEILASKFSDSAYLGDGGTKKRKRKRPRAKKTHSVLEAV